MKRSVVLLTGAARRQDRELFRQLVQAAILD
jgi:hypothetical protein